MKNIIIFLILLFPKSNIFSQEKINLNSHIQNRSGKLFFGLSLEARITPFYNEKDFFSMPKQYAQVNDESQNSGFAVSYSLNYFANKNLSFGFSNSFRNDILYNKSETAMLPTLKNSKSEKTIFIDYHLYSDYHIYISEKSQLFARFGYSFMNTNSDYNQFESIYQNGVYIGNIGVIKDFSFNALNYGIGYKINKFDILIGAFSSKNTPYTSTRYTIPYIKINYTFLKI